MKTEHERALDQLHRHRQKLAALAAEGADRRAIDTELLAVRAFAESAPKELSSAVERLILAWQDGA